MDRNNLEFRIKLVQMSDDLTEKNINDIKFILRSNGSGRLELVTNGISLLRTLQQLGYFKQNDITKLVELMGEISPTIATFLEGGERNNIKEIKGKNKVSAEDPAIPNLVLDTISSRAASDWRRLARNLELEESKIEEIDLDNKKVVEKAHAALVFWSQRREGLPPTLDRLKSIISKIGRNDVVRAIEKEHPETKPTPKSIQESQPPS